MGVELDMGEAKLDYTVSGFGVHFIVWCGYYMSLFDPPCS